MLKIVKQTAYIGFGLGSMSAKTIKRLGQKLMEEGRLSEEEGKVLVDDLLAQSKKSRREIEKNVRRSVRNVIEDMNIATEDDLSSIDIRLKSIEEELGIDRSVAALEDDDSEEETVSGETEIEETEDSSKSESKTKRGRPRKN